MRLMHRLRRLRKLVRNAVIDLRFGAPLGAIYLGNRSQSNSDYRELEAVFAGRIAEDAVLVDVGCGAGRAINQWLRMGVDGPIYGLEVDEPRAERTRHRLRNRTNVRIVSGDAVAHLPPDGTLFFLFNPFGEPTMASFAEAILQIATNSGRTLTVLYLNCKHLAVFEDRAEFVVDVQRLESSRSIAGQQVATILVTA